MGAENSKSNSLRQSEAYTDRAISQALEHQRLVYEAKLERLRKAQAKTVIVQQNQNMTNNQVPNHPLSPLYPTLSNLGHSSTPMTTNTYSNPGTPQYQAPTNQFRYAAQATTSVTMTQTAPRTPTAMASMTPTAPLAPTAPTLNYLSTAGQSKKTAIANTNTRMFTSSATPKSGMECVTCTNIFGEKIYQCNKGHSSCGQCRMRNARCGVCSNLISDMRNIMLEATMCDMKLTKNNNTERIKCYNSEDGCCLSFKINEMERHLKECPYREMACPLASIFGYCTWKGKINHMVAHFNEAHREHRVAEVDKEMTLSNIKLDHKIVNLVNIGNFIFLVHVVSIKQTVYMTVKLLGTKHSASKWTYEIHVYNKKEPRRKYQYVDTCHADLEPLADIFSENKCAVLPTDYVKTFLDNNVLSYKFYIKKDFNANKNKQRHS